jgi:hypothetical protein
MWIKKYWPFSAFKFDDLKESDGLVKKLAIPQHTKEFVFAIREPQSQAVIYILCVQNLSERSALDAEYLIREIKPDVVVAQIGESVPNEIDDKDAIQFNAKYQSESFPVPTSCIEVLKQCFIHKINKENYEDLAGNLVLREIFGVGFNGHFLAAKRTSEEIGSHFLILESPFLKSCKDNDSSALLPANASCLAPQKMFRIADDLRKQIVKSFSSNTIHLASEDANSRVSCDDNQQVQPRSNYSIPQFAESVYPLLVDLHDIFLDIPSIGKALAQSQKILYDVDNGNYVDTELISDFYIFRIAVEGLRIALNNAGRVPLKTLKQVDLVKENSTGFCDLTLEDKSHALLVQALRSQTKKYKSIVAIIDVRSLAGLRKNWNTPVPEEMKNTIEDLLVADNIGDIQSNNQRKRSLIKDKPVVAVGAGAITVLGASSVSKFLPATTTFVKLVTFKLPIPLKIMAIQTQKAVSILLGKSYGVKTVASALKFRHVAHGVVASAEKTSFSAMRTAFYEIMRTQGGFKRGRIGLLPWATFGFSVSTCTGLLVYGDGIECAVESLPSAPKIACLGRGIRSLHLASETIRDRQRSRVQSSIESLFCRFKKMKNPPK